MLIRSGRPGPLTVDTLPAFVQKQVGITSARVKFGEVIRDELKVGVVPRTLANSVSGVRHLIGECRVTLDAEIGAPGASLTARRRRESLTRGVRSGKTA